VTYRVALPTRAPRIAVCQPSSSEPTDYSVRQINKQDCSQQEKQRCKDDIQSRSGPAPHLSGVDIERGFAEPKRRKHHHRATQDDQQQSGNVADNVTSAPAKIVR
jgi:hypothetical protein